MSRGQCEQLFPNNSHLLGDSAYPNGAFLLTPYRDNGRLTLRQKNYNHKHSATRVLIEQTFGLLKTRFRILKFINIYRTELIPNIIMACCVLHNIAMQMGDRIEIEVEEDQDVFIEDNYNVIGDAVGNNKRNYIADIIG